MCSGMRERELTDDHQQVYESRERENPCQHAQHFTVPQRSHEGQHARTGEERLYEEVRGQERALPEIATPRLGEKERGVHRRHRR